MSDAPTPPTEGVPTPPTDPDNLPPITHEPVINVDLHSEDWRQSIPQNPPLAPDPDNPVVMPQWRPDREKK